MLLPDGRWAHSSVVEYLLCKEEALGSNPSGSIPFGSHREPCPLSGRRQNGDSRRRLMHHPARAWVGRVYARSSVTMRTCDDDRVYVQSRRSLDSTTRGRVPTAGHIRDSAALTHFVVSTLA